MLDEHLSFGDKILIKHEETGGENQDFQAAKNRGSEQMAIGNYKQAVVEFQTAIEKYRNAPETLIYLNNARTIGQNPFTIAVVVPIGNNSNGALEILRGVAQAQNEVNQAGGINGVPLKVLIANDDDDPKTAQNIALELVNNSKALGVIGHFSSDATLAAGQEYDAGKLAAISPISTITDPSQYIFYTVPSDTITARALVKHMMTKLQKQKAAVFYNSQSKYSMSLKTKFVEEVLASGGKIDEHLVFDLSNASFSARKSVEQAIAKRAQVMMLASDSSMLDKALLVIQANQKRLSLLGGNNLYSPKVLTDGGEAAVGLVAAVPWHIDADPQSNFSRTSQQLWQGKVNWRTATSYDAAQALIAALKRNPTREGVQQSLAAADFSATGASSKIRFSSFGDRYGSVQLVEVRPSTQPGTIYDFVPIR
ncbi:MAG: ABC transporter substrate-binding protein [Aetokthonos hydrillicola CCALA 1050]|nr:ABC transporter substrate-binding protein [Aetokthonos hydrillicola CCALA 1050]MBW4588095.1 ABC transporter substrate-binding protein [Aetokthonos hydrillicola CCALA 1050]